MNATHPNLPSFGTKLVNCAAACALAMGIAGTCSGRDLSSGTLPATAFVEVTSHEFDVAHLETAFWVCDHTATVHGVQATPVGVCSAVFEQLKAAKFGGDFNELLAWWHQNKATEHGKLEAMRADFRE